LIKDMPHPLGTTVSSVVIESDDANEWVESVKARNNVDHFSKDELNKIVQESGIVGLGGAAFPTHVKLSVKDKKIDTVILNGAECEPYLTADHSLMAKEYEKIIKGLKLIMKIVGASKGIIGVEDNKSDVIQTMADRAKVIQGDISVVSLKTLYPQGAEKMLIYSLLGRKVPPRGLPLDVNVVVNNVGTAKAVYDAVYEGKPLIERVVTVTGVVREPKNLLVKIGTLFDDVIKECGGAREGVKKIISGGPMMGISQKTALVPVVKGTSGILLLDKITVDEKLTCIRCSRCVDVCPMFLLPTTIAQHADKELYDLAESYNAVDCFECGCCAYVCPSKIPLVEMIKKGKMEIMKRAKK
jgi:electron transport complex protein RnfC